MDVSFRFLGGLATANNLTGSCTALEVRHGKKTTAFLIDVGLVQGDFKNFFANNRKILKSLIPSAIDYIILTHAHVDHVGLLPFLVNNGFRGKVICTQQTADLLPIMLEDSLKVQTELAKSRRQRAANQPKNQQRLLMEESRPLFTDDDVKQSIDLILKAGFPEETPIKLSNQISLKFYRSGHILGGAISVIAITEPKSKKTSYLGFSGDLGRQVGLLLYPPKIVKEPIDHWFTESTYGDKRHPEKVADIDDLFALATEADQAGKKIIIPSFALQRSQEIIYLLTLAMHKGRIPRMPIYLDSPMAVRITGIFAKYWAMGVFKSNGSLDFNPFNEENPYLKLIVDYEESIQLTGKPGPFIVISGSGMCDAGRVRNHLRFNLPKEQTIVCLVGYMAPTSLGRKLKDGLTQVNMNGETIFIKATIASFEGFSAHADSEELVSYAKAVLSADSLGRSVYILHGERTSGTVLKDRLDAEFHGRGIQVIIPNEKEEVKMKLTPPSSGQSIRKTSNKN